MDQFLAGVERRALRMAQLAVGNTDEALDIVQDAMLKLVQRYAGKPADEWGPLFHRILQSHIRDWYRRQKVRNRWRVWIGRRDDESAAVDAIQEIADPLESGPDRQLRNSEALDALAVAVAELPLRQRQAFLLRAWEGLDVAQTAAAMGCTAGSIKTHYSRAVHALRKHLGEHWP